MLSGVGKHAGIIPNAGVGCPQSVGVAIRRMGETLLRYRGLTSPCKNESLFQPTEEGLPGLSLAEVYKLASGQFGWKMCADVVVFFVARCSMCVVSSISTWPGVTPTDFQMSLTWRDLPLSHKVYLARLSANAGFSFNDFSNVHKLGGEVRGRGV